MSKKALSILSLCQKAGKLVSGELPCEKALQSKTAFLIILSEDASENTKKKFLNKAYYYDIPIVIKEKADVLSHAIGKVNRKVLAVIDENFANKIKELFEEK